MKIEIVEFRDDRFYRIEKDGKVDFYPSVTTKLQIIDKPGLRQWVGSVGNEAANHKMFEAQYRGKRIHKAWECYNQGILIKYVPYEKADMPEERPCFVFSYQDEYLDFLKLIEWERAVKPNILHSEFIVYSEKWREAGTIDNVMSIKGGKYKINGSKELDLPEGLYVCDLKTGKSIYDDAYMQIAAYAGMYEKMHKVPVVGGLILHTNAPIRSGIVGMATKYIDRNELIRCFQDFRHVSKVWERKNKNITPKQLSFPNMVKKEGV